MRERDVRWGPCNITCTLLFAWFGCLLGRLCARACVRVLVCVCACVRVCVCVCAYECIHACVRVCGARYAPSFISLLHSFPPSCVLLYVRLMCACSCSFLLSRPARAACLARRVWFHTRGPRLRLWSGATAGAGQIRCDARCELLCCCCVKCWANTERKKVAVGAV